MSRHFPKFVGEYCFDFERVPYDCSVLILSKGPELQKGPLHIRELTEFV